MRVCDKCKDVNRPASAITITVTKAESKKDKTQHREIYHFTIDLCEHDIPGFGSDMHRFITNLS